MSGPRMNVGQMNGTRRPNLARMPSNDRPQHSQHDELIRFIHESWTKVEMDRGTSAVMYYQEQESQSLKDFRPFDLDAYWGRRMHQHAQNHA
ncbi:uncharacterized protein LOC132707190 isoform X2 [Cylas formicarius]|uniref:uncharacterized protein LOC132707190 isoform X2 n=1 Tax=Cylas formicarius TaxID=197179 RepID=UPI0029587538|nr:uncharacterized protein LOC132707190 isoform X2 [Cylas formicarius]